MTMQKSTENLYDNVLDILSQYEGTPITLRQLYYRLVARGMPNNKNSYQRLIQMTGKWRKQKLLSMNAFVDRARNIMDFRGGDHVHNPSLWLHNSLERIEKYFLNYLEYDLSLWYGQPHRVFIGVEKNALVGVFEPVCNRYGVTLLPCVGYPSLSFLNEFSDMISHYDGNDGLGENLDKGDSEPHDYFLYFGDWDPSGLNIPESINNNMTEIEDFSNGYIYRHIALEMDQITRYDLIPAPAKTTDSRHDKFVSEYGKNVYELDALDPKVLQDLIKKTIESHIDWNIMRERNRRIDEGKKIISEYRESLKLNGALKIIRDAIESLKDVK